MGFIKTDYKDIDSHDLMKEGEYEVIITHAEFKQPEDKTPYISIDMTIRKDIDQAYSGKHVFDSLYKVKATGEYNEKRLQQILKCAGCAEGIDIDSEETFCYTIKDAALRVVIKIVEDTYNGETRKKERVHYYKPSEHKPQTLASYSTVASNPKAEDVDVDDSDSFPF